ncbi:6732_t:CDS:2, partial [Scutellospora calospora]
DMNHKDYRLELIKNLIVDASDNHLKCVTRSKDQIQLEEKKDNTKKIRINENFELSLDRFIGNDHLPVYNDKRDSL